MRAHIKNYQERRHDKYLFAFLQSLQSCKYMKYDVWNKSHPPASDVQANIIYTPPRLIFFRQLSNTCFRNSKLTLSFFLSLFTVLQDKMNKKSNQTKLKI